jgi:MFS family permease
MKSKLVNGIQIYGYRWVMLFILMALNIVVEIEWLTHAPVARAANVYYAGQFLPDSFFNIDFLAMSYMLIYLIVSFPVSYLIDTYGIKTALRLGAILIGSFSIIKGLYGDNFRIVLISQLGLAIAQPFAMNAMTAVTAKWFPVWERGLATGLATLSQYLGIVIAMVVTPFLVQASPELANYGSGFKSMLMIYGMISLVTSVLVFTLVKNDPPNPPSKEFKRFQFAKGLKHIFSNRDMQVMIIVFFLGLGIFNSVSTMVDAIAANMGVKDSDGLIGGAMLIGGIIGAVIIPTLSDKYRKRKAFLVLCIFGMLPGITGLAFAAQLTGGAGVNPDAAYQIALISSFILGFFIMSAGPIGFQYAAEVSSPAPEAASQGLLLFAGQISGILIMLGMGMKQNAYIDKFMYIFVFVSVLLPFAILKLKESPMIITEADRVKAFKKSNE